MKEVNLKLIPELILVGIAALMIGCGGDSSGSSLTKQEFIAKGNEICKAAEGERLRAMEATARKLGIPLGKSPPPAKRDQIILAGIVSYEKASEKLRENAPEGEEEKVEAIVEAMEEAAEKVQADPGTTYTTNIQFKDASALLNKYGLTHCAL